MESREGSVNPHVFWEKTDKLHERSIFQDKIKQEQRVGSAADKAAANAKTAARIAYPGLTVDGVKLLTSSSMLSPLGLPLAIGGFFIDTIKAPISLAVATEEGARAGITKLASLLFERKSGKEQAMDEIFRSFLIRMRETATLLVALGLEDVNALDQKLKSGDIEELVGLTLLHTAYASREDYANLHFANNKLLERKDCPAEGLALFDKVWELKTSIEKALSLSGAKRWIADKDTEAQLEHSRVVCQWIKLIKAGKPISVAEKTGSTEEQVAIVNKIISQIEALKQLGMQMLPESPAAVVSHLPRAVKI